MKERAAVELFRACLADCTPRGRDNRAWGEFVLRFQPLLRSSVARVLRRLDQRSSPEIIDDLVQDVYCRLLERGSEAFRGDNEGEVVNYLKRVCESVAVDRLRGRITQKRGGGTIVIDLDPNRRTLGELIADGGASPEEMCLHRELRGILLDGCRLHYRGPCPERNVAIFELAVLDGWTSREIADSFDWGLKTGSIDSVVHRQRRRLKRRGLEAPER
jgi:DNA-directed RNA polymerase specialized sigma24 family protein